MSAFAGKPFVVLVRHPPPSGLAWPVAFAQASANILRAVIGGHSIRAAVEGELALHPESADGVHTAIATVLAEVDAGTPYSQASSKYMPTPPPYPTGLECLHFPAESVNADEEHILCVLCPRYGIGCPNPASFKCALHAALTASSYADAVRQIILGGGDRFARPSRFTAYLSYHAPLSRIRYPAMPMTAACCACGMIPL